MKKIVFITAIVLATFQAQAQDAADKIVNACAKKAGITSPDHKITPEEMDVLTKCIDEATKRLSK